LNIDQGLLYVIYENEIRNTKQILYPGHISRIFDLTKKERRKKCKKMFKCKTKSTETISKSV